VCVTQGLLDLVSREELEGVLDHELAHVQHRDMLLQTVTATMAGAISYLAQFAILFGGGRDGEDRGHPVAGLAMVIFAPIAAALIQLAMSRQREFKADAGGAAISGPVRPGQPAGGVPRRAREAILDPPARRGADRAARGPGGLSALGLHSG
jgi:Zn-dependent protease with chaperone function